MSDKNNNTFFYGYIFVSMVTIGVLIVFLVKCESNTSDNYEPESAMYSYYDEQSGDDRDLCNCSPQGHCMCSNRLQSQKSYARGATEYQDFSEEQAKAGGVKWDKYNGSNCGC
jgi:hypothetical protein